MSIPRATVRLQLHPGFTLRDAQAQIPYYAKLGVSHFYLSPITRARQGSTHGYDVIDHTVVNPELGGESAFRSMARALRAQGMGLFLDIVPNNMDEHTGNAWTRDVFRQARPSPYAQYVNLNSKLTPSTFAGSAVWPYF